MAQYDSIETPQDYVNYTFNVSAKGTAHVAGELAGLSNTVSTILGDIAFKTSEFLAHTEIAAIGAGTAVAAAFTAATKDAIRFQQQVANVKAIGGESVDAQLIGDKAIEYSNKFGMATSSMTEGLEALARAGITTTSVMAGVLEEGVKLSKLEGMDLEESINSLIASTNLLSTENVDMNAPEYAQMLKEMNQHIVSTSESAPINAQNIIQTLQHVGGYASAANMDQDDLFATIAQLGSRGTKGEMAGTALRAFIAAGQKDTAQRALARIGLDVTDLWTESGESMLPLSEMKKVLDDALEARGFSKQEKLEFYSDFAGYKQANQIMKIDTEEVQQYKKAIEDSWNLSTKLDTILGTVKGNLDRIHQIGINFMTKVGNRLLPIFNAILVPIRWGLTLLDKIPFAHTGTALLMIYVSFKTILAVVNKIVPAVGGMFSNFDDGREKVKGIRGEFHNLARDIEQSKETLGAVFNRDKDELRRQHSERRGPSAKSKEEARMHIGGVLWEQTRHHQNHDVPWNKVDIFQREDWLQRVEGTKEFQDAYEKYVANIKSKNKEAIKFIGTIDDEESYDYGNSLERISNYTKYIYDMLKDGDAPQSKLEQNKEANAQKGDFSFPECIKICPDSVGLLASAIASLISGNKDDTSNRSSGGSPSSVGGPSSSSSSGRRKDDDVVIKIEEEKDSNIPRAKDVKSEVLKIKMGINPFYYGDYSFDERFKAEEDLNKAHAKALKDLQKKIENFSNVDVNNMNADQYNRLKKSLIRTPTKQEYSFAVDYSARSNASDIKRSISAGVYRQPAHKKLGIRDAQIQKMAEMLGIEDEIGPIDNIHGRDNREYQLKKIHQAFINQNQVTMDDILKETSKIWKDQENKKFSPRFVPTNVLNKNLDMSKEIAQALSISTNGDVVRNIQSYMMTAATDEQIDQAIHIMFKHMKTNEKVLADIEAEEIKYVMENIARIENTFDDLGIELKNRYFKDRRKGPKYTKKNSKASVLAEKRAALIQAIEEGLIDPSEVEDEYIREQYKDWIKTTTPDNTFDNLLTQTQQLKKGVTSAKTQIKTPEDAQKLAQIGQLIGGDLEEEVYDVLKNTVFKYESVWLPDRGEFLSIPLHSAYPKYITNKNGKIKGYDRHYMQKVKFNQNPKDTTGQPGVRNILHSNSMQTSSWRDKVTFGDAVLGLEDYTLENPFKPDAKTGGKKTWGIVNTDTGLTCINRADGGTCILGNDCYAFIGARTPVGLLSQLAKMSYFYHTPIDQITKDMDALGLDTIRVNQEGDFNSINEFGDFAKMVALAKANPDKRMYGYTKNLDVLKYIEEEGLPDNFTMNNSLGTWEKQNYVAGHLVEIGGYLRRGYKWCLGVCTACEQCLNDMNQLAKIEDSDNFNKITLHRKVGKKLLTNKDKATINKMSPDERTLFFSYIETLMVKEGYAEAEALVEAMKQYDLFKKAGKDAGQMIVDGFVMDGLGRHSPGYMAKAMADEMDDTKNAFVNGINNIPTGVIDDLADRLEAGLIDISDITPEYVNKNYSDWIKTTTPTDFKPGKQHVNDDTLKMLKMGLSVPYDDFDKMFRQYTKNVDEFEMLKMLEYDKMHKEQRFENFIEKRGLSRKTFRLDDNNILHSVYNPENDRTLHYVQRGNAYIPLTNEYTQRDFFSRFAISPTKLDQLQLLYPELVDSYKAATNYDMLRYIYNEADIRGEGSIDHYLFSPRGLTAGEASLSSKELLSIYGKYRTKKGFIVNLGSHQEVQEAILDGHISRKQIESWIKKGYMRGSDAIDTALTMYEIEGLNREGLIQSQENYWNAKEAEQNARQENEKRLEEIDSFTETFLTYQKQWGRKKVKLQKMQNGIAAYIKERSDITFTQKEIQNAMKDYGRVDVENDKFVIGISGQSRIYSIKDILSHSGIYKSTLPSNLSLSLEASQYLGIPYGDIDDTIKDILAGKYSNIDETTKLFHFSKDKDMSKMKKDISSNYDEFKHLFPSDSAARKFFGIEDKNTLEEKTNKNRAIWSIINEVERREATRPKEATENRAISSIIADVEKRAENYANSLKDAEDVLDFYSASHEKAMEIFSFLQYVYPDINNELLKDLIAPLGGKYGRMEEIEGNIDTEAERYRIKSRKITYNNKDPLEILKYMSNFTLNDFKERLLNDRYFITPSNYTGSFIESLLKDNLINEKDLEEIYPDLSAKDKFTFSGSFYEQLKKTDSMAVWRIPRTMEQQIQDKLYNRWAKKYELKFIDEKYPRLPDLNDWFDYRFKSDGYSEESYKRAAKNNQFKDKTGVGGFGYGSLSKNMEEFNKDFEGAMDEAFSYRDKWHPSSNMAILRGQSNLDRFKDVGSITGRIKKYGIYIDPRGRADDIKHIVNLKDKEATEYAYKHGYVNENQLKKWLKLNDNLAYTMDDIAKWNIEEAINSFEKSDLGYKIRNIQINDRNITNRIKKEGLESIYIPFDNHVIRNFPTIHFLQSLKEKKDTWFNSWFNTDSDEFERDYPRAALRGSPKAIPGQTSLDDFVTAQVETQKQAPNGAKTKPLEWGMPGMHPDTFNGISIAKENMFKALQEEGHLKGYLINRAMRISGDKSTIPSIFTEHELDMLNIIKDVFDNDYFNTEASTEEIESIEGYVSRFIDNFLLRKTRKNINIDNVEEDTTQTHNAPFVMTQQIRDFINNQKTASNTSTDQARTKREKENQYNIRWLLNSLVLTKGQRGLIQRLLMKGDNEAIVKEIKRSNAQVSDKDAKTVADYLMNNPHELDKIRNDNFKFFRTDEDFVNQTNVHIPLKDETDAIYSSIFDSHFFNRTFNRNTGEFEDIQDDVNERNARRERRREERREREEDRRERRRRRQTNNATGINWHRLRWDDQYYQEVMARATTTNIQKFFADTLRGGNINKTMLRYGYHDVTSAREAFINEFGKEHIGGALSFDSISVDIWSRLNELFLQEMERNREAKEAVNDSVAESFHMFEDIIDAGRFKRDMDALNKTWKQTGRYINLVTGYLNFFMRPLQALADTFPLLSPIIAPITALIQKASQIGDFVSGIEHVMTVAQILKQDISEITAKEAGMEAEWADAQIIKSLLGNGPAAQELYNIFGNITEQFTVYFGKVQDYIAGKALVLVKFIISNIAIIGPIIAGIAATIAGLWVMEKRHAKALKETQEELEELNAKTLANITTYKDLHKQRENETDALKRQQLARREAIALYQLEVNGLKKLNAINKQSQLKSDTLWGEYGMRAGWQRFTHGHNLLSGEFQSLYENYDGTTKNIRQIREEVVGNLFATSAQREVAAYYDANILAFGEIEAFSKELNELYDKESQLIEEYGSIEAARETEEFNKAVQEFSDATRLNGETAVKYLDWLETENKVDKATQAMQVEVDMIVAEARRNMFAALYPDRDFNSATGIRDAMIYAQADQMIKDAYDQLWWDAFGNTLWGYFDLILYALNPADWVGELLGWENTHAKMAKKHFDAADAADKGLHELVENTDNIIKIGEEAADNADRRNYGTKSSIYNDEPFGFAISNAIYMEKNAISDGTKSIEDVLSYGMKKAGEEGVSSFKEGLNQHSPGDISNSVLDELVYSQNFIEALTPLLGESFALLGQEEVLKHNQGLGKDGDLPGHISSSISDELIRSQDFIETSTPLLGESFALLGQEEVLKHNQGLGKDGDLPGHISGSISDELLHSQNFIETSTPLLNTSFSSLGQEEVLGHNQGLGKDGDSPGLIPKHTQQELDYTKNVLQENQEPIGQASYDLGYETGQQYAKGFKDGLNDLYEQVSTQEALSDTLKQKILYNQGLKTAPNKQSVPNDETKETAIESVADVGSFVLPKILGQLGEAVFKKFVKKGVSKGLDELGEATGKTGLKTAGKTFTKIAPYIGPAVTAANAIYEHNPYEKHYNEDGSEKRALQATGEVVGETAGALAAMGLGRAVEGAVTAFTLNPVLGFIAGAGVEMVASLILEPIGEAIGGTIGWLADEIVNTPIKDIWGGFNDALGGIPGQIYDFIDQSPIGDLGHWAFNQLDSLTGGRLSSTWDYISNSSIASMAGDAWNQMSGAASSTWDWLSGAAGNTWDWLSGAANNTWNWLFGGEEKSQSALNNGHNLLLTTDGMTVGPQWSAPPAEGLRGSLYEQIEGRKDPILGVFYTLRRLLYNNDKEPIYSKYDISKNGKVSYDSAKAEINKKTKDISTDNSKNTIVIKNININTEDDPEKIKTAFMNLMIELEEQITPRQVSRVVGEAPSASTNATADTDATNPDESTDPNASTNPNDTSQNGTNNTNPTL